MDPISFSNHARTKTEIETSILCSRWTSANDPDAHGMQSRDTKVEKLSKITKLL